MVHTFVSPLKIVAGEGAIEKVPEAIASFDAKRVMVFADPSIVEIGLLKKLEDVLSDAQLTYKIYSDLQPEPPLAIGDQAVQALKDFQADFVIGMGGGSSLDIAKAASVLYSHEGKVQDYLNLSGTRKLTHKGLPKMLIPTTAGTGAEVTDIAVFSLEETKDVITDEYLLADVAVVDPELTYTLPPRITASTGVDALTHAVEALVSVNATPLTDALALEAIRKISGNIRTAVWHGSNTDARREMAWGSLLAGLSFYNAGVAGVHALAYPLGGLFHIPHGEANAVLLPYIFDYIWPSCLEKMTDMARALGLKTETLSKREVALEAVKELRNLVKDVGLPSTLKAYGIREQDLDTLAKNGIEQKRLLARSPKPFTLESIRERYKAAYTGEMMLGH
mgnify:CR=1 FL=1